MKLVAVSILLAILPGYARSQTQTHGEPVNADSTADPRLITLPLKHVNATPAIVHGQVRRARGVRRHLLTNGEESKEGPANRILDSVGLELECPPRLRIRLADFSWLFIIKSRISSKYSLGRPALEKRRRNAPLVLKAKRQENATSTEDKKTLALSRNALSRSTATSSVTPVQTAQPSQNADPSSIALKDYIIAHEDMDFEVEVMLGTPPKPFSLIVDTGSSDLGVQSSGSCQNCSRNPATFDHSSSSSARDLQQSFDITYGIGSTSGDLFTDVVSVAGKTVQNQTFAVADEMSGEWQQQPASGILGLGFQTNAKSGAPPFFENLMSEGAVSEKVFSFLFGRANDGLQDKSSMTLGGTGQRATIHKDVKGCILIFSPDRSGKVQR